MKKKIRKYGNDLTARKRQPYDEVDVDQEERDAEFLLGWHVQEEPQGSWPLPVLKY